MSRSRFRARRVFHRRAEKGGNSPQDHMFLRRAVAEVWRGHFALLSLVESLDRNLVSNSNSAGEILSQQILKSKTYE